MCGRNEFKDTSKRQFVYIDGEEFSEIPEISIDLGANQNYGLTLDGLQPGLSELSEAVRRIGHTVLEAAKVLQIHLSAIHSCFAPRKIVHLAHNAKKWKTRKKNQKRILKIMEGISNE